MRVTIALVFGVAHKFWHSTDGLVIAASFYASPLIGATSTLACFAHEIPHEIADFSILLRSGFTKRQAMASQFLTAIGAFCGYVAGDLRQSRYRYSPRCA